MKRKKIIFILMITVIIFIGCNGDKKDMKELSMTLTLDGDFNKKIVIPDPVTAGDECRSYSYVILQGMD